MGSKARFAKELLPIILEGRTNDQWYVEPFVGGGNLIDKVRGNRLANDSNEYLVAFLQALADGYVPPMLSREEYQTIRKNNNDFPRQLVGYAGVCCSYSGVWFGSYAGEVKTLINTTRNYQAEAQKNILKQAPFLRGIVFKSGSYLDLNLPEGAIVYCDPPYAGTSKYKDDFDHAVFWDWCNKVAKTHRIFVSEYTAPDNWESVWSKQVGSSLSANGKSGGRKKSVERLFAPIKR